MSANVTNEDILRPTTLQEAINIIKFLTTTHKGEVSKLKESNAKQAANIKKLEANRKKELEFLSSELLKYEINLAERTECISQQIADKDKIIQKQMETIEELNKKLSAKKEFIVPEIVIDSNSDSGVVLENEEMNISIAKSQETKVDVKATRKCSKRFADSIQFLRRVDFSPMKYKPNNRDVPKKREEKKNTLEVPILNRRIFTRQFSNDKPISDDERIVFEDTIFSKEILPVIVRPKKLNESMNNRFSEDESDDTSEEVFDRVMTRSSIRRSAKGNPKYKKINRSKSKLLEHVKVNIVD